MYQSVLGCTKVFQSLLGCTKICQSVLGCTKVNQSVTEYTRVYQSVPECTRVMNLFLIHNRDDNYEALLGVGVEYPMLKFTNSPSSIFLRNQKKCNAPNSFALCKNLDKSGIKMLRTTNSQKSNKLADMLKWQIH